MLSEIDTSGKNLPYPDFNGTVFQVLVADISTRSAIVVRVDSCPLVGLERVKMHKKLICVLCDKEAMGASAQIPTCAEHNEEYDIEGQLYLPLSMRPVYQRLIEAYEQRYEHGYFGQQRIMNG